MNQKTKILKLQILFLYIFFSLFLLGGVISAVVAFNTGDALYVSLAASFIPFSIIAFKLPIAWHQKLKLLKLKNAN